MVGLAHKVLGPLGHAASLLLRQRLPEVPHPGAHAVHPVDVLHRRVAGHLGVEARLVGAKLQHVAEDRDAVLHAIVDRMGRGAARAVVVTLEDLVEEIVGEVSDEHDRSGTATLVRCAT